MIECPLCNKKFNHIGALTNHAKFHHIIELEDIPYLSILKNLPEHSIEEIKKAALAAYALTRRGGRKTVPRVRRLAREILLNGYFSHEKPKPCKAKKAKLKRGKRGEVLRNKFLTIKLTEEEKSALKDFAELKGLSVSELIRQTVFERIRKELEIKVEA